MNKLEKARTYPIMKWFAFRKMLRACCLIMSLTRTSVTSPCVDVGCAYVVVVVASVIGMVLVFAIALHARHGCRCLAQASPAASGTHPRFAVGLVGPGIKSPGLYSFIVHGLISWAGCYNVVLE